MDTLFVQTMQQFTQQESFFRYDCANLLVWNLWDQSHTRGRVLQCNIRADTETGTSMRVFAIESAVASAHRSSRKICTASAGASYPKSSVERVKISPFISD